jgi:hypothetical protein
MKVKLKSTIEIKSIFDIETGLLNKILKVESSLSTLDIINFFILPPVKVEKNGDLKTINLNFDVEIVSGGELDLDNLKDLGLYIKSVDSRFELIKANSEVVSVHANNEPFKVNPILSESFLGKAINKIKNKDTNKASSLISMAGLVPRVGSLADGTGGGSPLDENDEEEENKNQELVNIVKKLKGYCK